MTARTILKRTGMAIGALALLLAALWFARPLYLDRIYYRGPVSAHFDGQRFFNPDEERTPLNVFRIGFGRLWANATGQRSAQWPESIAVTPSRPPARVDGQKMRVTWIGHATVLIQTQGLNILTDPIWSDVAGPWNRLGPRRSRAPGVRFEDLPKIDLVLISHNHYDHMDLPTLQRLWTRDRPLIVTSLGNDTLLKQHGIGAVARDWAGAVPVRPGISVIVERVHHWSSRWGEDRNRALWSGFTITLPGGNIFFAGDTGWGDGGWPALAARHGPFRLAILPIGAYHPRAIFGRSHIDPAQAIAAFRALGATQALGIHWGTFQLTDEGADTPRLELAQRLQESGIATGRFVTTDPGNPLFVPLSVRPGEGEAGFAGRFSPGAKASFQK
ncbi:MAG: Zn-dependent hydrolase [Rhizorhabdus sp.]|nr:MAG: Zn-dependent hydrolase [Rhizorhabdus sp.]